MLKPLLYLLGSTLLALSHAAPADFRRDVQQLLAGDQPVAGQTLYAKDLMQRMYQGNGGEPLWRDQSIANLLEAIDGLDADGLTPGDYRFPQIDAYLRARSDGSLSPGQAAELDLLLTEAFARAVYNLYFGKVDAERLDSNINFARSLDDDQDPAMGLLRAIEQGDIAAAFDRARPQNIRHRWLRDALAQYRAYQAAGGWDPVPEGKTLKPGESDPGVTALRARLAVTGDLAGTDGADPEYFDEQLEAAVKGFQQRHYLEADGAVGPATLAALNVPVQQRIDQIRVNLERQRWIMHEAYDEFLVVDIAGFHVYWVKDDEIIWEEQVQVGKEFTQTPVFKDRIRYLELNPTWTIPPGILRRSILPALKKDSDYLSKKGYQLLTQDGKPVNPARVDWKSLKGVPYIVRQPPGPDNALGLVKFMFPNPHYVFLHDTNHRELFDRTNRTFSSGCVRVRNPFDLAERLLAGQGDWDRARIDQVVASGRTTRVDLERPVRILIAYGTASANGEAVYFKPDVYKRDARVLAALDGEFRVRERDLQTAMQ